MGKLSVISILVMSSIIGGKPLASELAGADENPLKPKQLSFGEPVNEPDSDAYPVGSDQAVLPNLFNLEKKEATTSFGGKVLSDPEGVDYLDSVNGAQVSIEVKTD